MGGTYISFPIYLLQGSMHYQKSVHANNLTDILILLVKIIAIKMIVGGSQLCALFLAGCLIKHDSLVEYHI